MGFDLIDRKYGRPSAHASETADHHVGAAIAPHGNVVGAAGVYLKEVRRRLIEISRVRSRDEAFERLLAPSQRPAPQEPSRPAKSSWWCDICGELVPEDQVRRDERCAEIAAACGCSVPPVCPWCKNGLVPSCSAEPLDEFPERFDPFDLPAYVTAAGRSDDPTRVKVPYRE